MGIDYNESMLDRTTIVIITSVYRVYVCVESVYRECVE